MARPFSTILAGDGGTFKICATCQLPKPIANFGRHSGRIDGLSPNCLPCISATGKKYYLQNKEKVAATNANWVAKNPEKRRNITRRFRESNPGYDVEWRRTNPTARAKAAARSAKARENPQKRLDNAMSCGVRDSIVRGSKARSRWEKLVGYTAHDLKAHLEKLFQQGMTWDNYGRGGWHVDHIIPKVAFNYSTPDDFDFSRCWALSNLQPLWERDNLSKQAKLDKPFQPSLRLAVNDNFPPVAARLLA